MAIRIGVASLGRVSNDTGGRNYIEHFFRALAHIEHGHEFVLFLSDDEATRLKLGDAPPELISLPNTSASSFRKVYGEQIQLPRAIRDAKIDLMYFPGNFASYNCPVPYVVNIRAVAHYYGALYGIDLPRRTIRKLLMPFSARRAARIITPSEDLKQDIVRFTGAKANTIEVIPHGVDASLFNGALNWSQPEGELILGRLGLTTNEYLLYVSALWRYKNQDKLIRAHAALVQEGKISIPLVIAGVGTGTEKEYVDGLHALPAQLGTDHLVRFTGQLPQSDLRYLYARARAFIFPSSYESFGNPIFESWASGIPIATSNTHSFPEIVQDAGLMFNPMDQESMKAAILEVTTNDELRSSLITKGLERVGAFSWDLCVRRTLSVLERV